MKAKYQFVIEKIEDQFVAVPIGPEAESITVVLNLNESAADILRLLAEERTEEQLIEELLKEYDVPKQLLVERVRIGVQELIRRGMVA